MQIGCKFSVHHVHTFTFFGVRSLLALHMVLIFFDQLQRLCVSLLKREALAHDALVLRAQFIKPAVSSLHGADRLINLGDCSIAVVQRNR
jgi:hypothetical protein